MIDPDPAAVLTWIGRPSARRVAPWLCIVVGHPDDETALCGARLGALAPRAIVTITDGAPRDPWFAQRAGVAGRAEYAALRARELATALDVGGVDPRRAATLALVDQEAALALAVAARVVAATWERDPPDVVITHAYEGGHPDHDATAFAVAAAAQMVARPPTIVEGPLYHDGNGDGQTTYGRFLPPPRPTPEIVAALDEEQRARKRRMLETFRSQREVLARLPLEVERFRIAPAYDFRRPPHPGRLHYERWGWPLTGARFCDLASAALSELGLSADGRAGAG
jgi:LmbE family N-acetylglucosaminyl deacetylase